MQALRELLDCRLELTLQVWRSAKGAEALAAGQAAYNEVQNMKDTIDKPIVLPSNSRALPQ